MCDDAEMILVDAIEAWGQAHKTHLERSNLEKLGEVWSTIRTADVGSRPVANMSKEDARDVMLLFGEEDRGDIADLLNTIRTWTLEHEGTSTLEFDQDAGDDHDAATLGASNSDANIRTLDVPGLDTPAMSGGSIGTPSARSAPLAPPLEAVPDLDSDGASGADDGFSRPELLLTDTQAMPNLDSLAAPPSDVPLSDVPLSDMAPPAATAQPVVGAPPVITAPTASMAPQSRLSSPEVIPQGPAPALPPPLGYAEDKPEPPYKWIGIALLAAIVLVGAYLIFSGDDTTPTDGDAETTTTTTDDETAAAAQNSGEAGIVDATSAVAPQESADPLTQFCTDAQAFDIDPTIAPAARVQGEAYFSALIDGWTALSAGAPANIANDFATVQAEYVAQRDVSAAAGYDMQSAALLNQLDSRNPAALNAAQANIANVLLSSCQLDVGGYLG